MQDWKNGLRSERVSHRNSLDLLQSAMGVSLQIELVDRLVDEPPEAKAHLQRALTASHAPMRRAARCCAIFVKNHEMPATLPELLAAAISQAQ